MELRLTQGGMWDGVEFDAAVAPQIVRLSGTVVDDEDIEIGRAHV